jgi:hypothetical protein
MMKLPTLVAVASIRQGDGSSVSGQAGHDVREVVDGL